MTLDDDFRIGDRVVQPQTNTVVAPEGEARLEPKAMQVLALLARRAGEVVTKQEILSEVWEGTFVSDEVLPNAIWELRKALGDDAKRPRFIQTLPKKGYRLIALVSEAPPNGAAEPSSTFEWQEKRWIPLAAAAAIAAVLLGYWLARDDAPRGTTADVPFSVLVMSFENHAREEDLAWLDTGVPTMLRTGLAELSNVQIVSEESLDRRGLPADTAREEVARRAGADALVRGSIFRQGDEYRIDVQVESVENARIIAAHSARGGDVFQLVDELTAWVRDTLDANGKKVAEPVKPLREVTTTSLEAFRLYNEGVEARKHLRLDDARGLLQEAIRIDPGFALAYVELQGVALMSKDYEGYDRYRAAALEHKGRLPQHRRALFDAMALWKEDPEKAEELLENVLERLPEEEEAYMHLSHLYRSRFEPLESLRVLERGVAALPHSGYLRLHYGYSLLWEGRYPEAIDQFEIYARIHPEEANPWDSLGEAYLIAGIPERALEKYARALEIDPDFTGSRLGRAWAHGLTGRFDAALTELDAIGENFPPHFTHHEVAFFQSYLLSRSGRYRDAFEILSRLESRLEESSTPSSAPMRMAIRQFRGLLQIERGRHAEALAEIEGALALEDPENEGKPRQFAALSRLLAGVAASRSGDLSTAKLHLAELGEIYESRDPRESWWYHLLLGELALASGDARAAYAAFTQGEPRQKLMFNVILLMESLGGSLSLRDGSARAKAAEGDRRAAMEHYRRLLRPDIGQKWTAVLEPRFYLELARLEKEEGERDEAAKHYRQFLELWSNADPGLPEIVEAEAYLASAS